MDRTATSAIRRTPASVALVALGLLVWACTGERGAQGPAPPTTPTPTVVGRAEDAPALEVTILGIDGASGSDGGFRVGDRVAVRFTLEQEDGSPWSLDELADARALVSGPTFNYQRVVTEFDPRASATREADGSFTLRFPPLPATYAAPYNDSASFDGDDGERTGRALDSGTYTLGLSFAWEYTVRDEPHVQVGEATLDFALGPGAGPVAPRAVVGEDNCNSCHVRLSAHEGRHRSVTLCLMCHTAGAEDRNDPAIEGGTPGVTIDARVLFHALHNGRYQPSVLGVATNPDGSRDYAATPRPMRLVGADGTVHDYSDTGWPVMPNRVLPMPADVGYALLTADEQALEERMRGGVVACASCHGDPDGAGPLEAPADGDSVYFQQTRKACGSCHDDVDWELPYVAQNQEMPPQLDDSMCIFCHDSRFGGALAPTDGHTHPYEDPFVTEGLAVELVSVSESGMHDADGTLDPGEKIRVRFRVTNAAGTEVGASTLDVVRVLVAGPTNNHQTLLVTEMSPALFSTAQPYVGNLPWRRTLEYVGDASSATGETFTTPFTPHVVGPGVATRVRVRTGAAGGNSALAGAVARHQNYLDVLDGSGFARGDVVVIDDGVPGFEEYVEVRFVEDDRLWLSSPNRPNERAAAELDHPAGATVDAVTLIELAPTDYALAAASGAITELAEFGDGNAVLVDYTTDFVVPADYPTALNGSPDLDDGTGKWVGKDLEDGTYTVAITVHQDVVAFAMGQLTTYGLSSPPATRDVLVGDATTLEPYARIASGDVCNACHVDLTYHDGRDRGFETCILCHGSPGAEDLPRYVSANAPETPGESVHFRTLLHRIHRGSDLARAYVVVGADDAAPYPDDFVARSFDAFVFPAVPGRTAQCAKCHLDADTFFPEERRAHSTQQLRTPADWGYACASCHDSAAAAAHIETHTAPSGGEACAICHGAGEVEDVLLVHRARD